MNLRTYLILFMLIFGMNTMKGQQTLPSPLLLKGNWSASWITHPYTAQREYGIYHFRKVFDLAVVPSTFVINVTADNRYRLFVNGTAVCSGPARGDLFNWFYDTVDIATYLKKGKNTIAAVVWNMGELAPVAQISNQTGLLVQGNSAAEESVNTGTDWKVLKDIAYEPCSVDNGKRLGAYMVVGPGDKVDGTAYPWDWEKNDFNDQSWENALEITNPQPVGYGTDNRWTLVPRSIPLFRETLVRFPLLRRSSLPNTPASFLTGLSPMRLAPHHTVSILLDGAVNIAAYPELNISFGKGSVIKMTYAESLFDSAGHKGNRNEIAHKEIKGNYDVFIADGGKQRKFRPLWFRAYRYLQLDIITEDEPLVINDIYSMKTGYPLELKATFASSDASLQEIWKTGWRTAQLCAGDSYYDTPYYEQLQYTGDTRIQALISLYMTGDDRLMKKAILDFYHSRTPEGLTQGRYPSNRLQIIPPFSLFWVSMIHDYWMNRKDDSFIRQFIPAIYEVMNWYQNRIDKDRQMLGPLNWWNFVDWDNFNDWGSAPGAEKGNTAIITLQYAYTLNQAADLFAAFNEQGLAVRYRKLAADLGQGTIRACYNQQKGLIADTPDQLTYSQHANIWAILSGALSPVRNKETMKRLLEDQSIGQATFFYRFYLTQALKKADMADKYYAELKPWRDMLALGLTTFAEKPEPTRSDCHAWSASPNYDFLATICGIMPAAPGFAKVLIKPALGELSFAEGTMPSPSGMIAVKLHRLGQNGLRAEITLPPGLNGELVWENKSYALESGMQKLDL